MARNYVESVKQNLFIVAPKIEVLDMNRNQIEIIDIEIHVVYPEIRYLYFSTTMVFATTAGLNNS